MPEKPENWWEITPDEDKQDDTDSPNPHNGSPPPPPPPPPGQDDTDSPEPIAIRGYQREGDQWAKKGKEEGDGTSEGDPTEWSDYSKQKAVATGVFLFTFLVGDWWWDGSNGFGALIQIPSEISDWPYRYSWVSDLHPHPIVLLISWALWDITPAVFLFLFLFGSNIVYAANLNDLKEDSSEIRRIGKKANRNLKYFVFALILMDFIVFAAEDPFAINTFLDYPTAFFAMRPGIHWMLVAFAASFGLDPDNEWYKRS
jgi:hypothetical protein